jgi:arginase
MTMPVDRGFRSGEHSPACVDSSRTRNRETELEPHQRAGLVASQIRSLQGRGLGQPELRTALDDLRDRVTRVYLHIDLDSLDPGEGVANQHSSAGGLSTEQLVSALDEVFDRFEAAAAAVTAYNPDCDRNGQIAATARRVLSRIAERAVSVT